MAQLFVGFGGGSFMPAVLDNVNSSSSEWASLELDLTKRSEHPSFSLALGGGTDTLTFDPRAENPGDPILLAPGTSEIVESVREPFFVSMDRVFLKPLSMNAREALLFRYVHGWTSFLKKHLPSPGDFYFTSTPHFHWDIAMSAVLQANGWRGFTFTQQGVVNGRVLLRRLRGAQVGELYQVSREQGSDEQNTTSESASIMASMRKNDQVLGSLKFRKFSAKLVFLPKLFWYSLFPHRFGYISAARLRLIGWSFRWGVNRIRLLRWLKVFGLRNLPEGPFVYFSLHSQPERTTVPDAGPFWYQPNAISELRQVLSPEITIVVGEHPVQIGRQGPDLRQTNFRSTDDYSNIASIPNVRIAHPTLRAAELTRNAILVASCTGTVGWEALQLGKPVICFGRTWYSEVPGCYTWEEGKDNTTGLESVMVAQGTRVNSAHSQLIRRVEKYGWPGLDAAAEILTPQAFGHSDDSWDAERLEMALALAQALLEGPKEVLG